MIRKIQRRYKTKCKSDKCVMLNCREMLKCYEHSFRVMCSSLPMLCRNRDFSFSLHTWCQIKNQRDHFASKSRLSSEDRWQQKRGAYSNQQSFQQATLKQPEYQPNPLIKAIPIQKKSSLVCMVLLNCTFNQSNQEMITFNYTL